MVGRPILVTQLFHISMCLKKCFKSCWWGELLFWHYFIFFTLWPSRFLSLFVLICLSCPSSECRRHGVLPATLPLCTLGSSSKTRGSGAQLPLLPWHLPSLLQHPLLQWGPLWLWQPSTALPPTHLGGNSSSTIETQGHSYHQESQVL